MSEFPFDASVARNYEAHLVPRLFEPWARTLVERLPPRAGQAALDVACGTGTVARTAARRVGAHGKVTALDASEEMVALASRRTAPAERATLSWRVSPAVPLAADDESFDVCYCQQGLQFFPDRVAALREMRRVLKARGRLGVSVWAEPSPPFPCLLDALRETEPDLADFAMAPWSWTDGGALEEAVRAAGFQEVALATLVLPYRWEGGADAVIEGVCGIPLGPRLDALPGPRREAVLLAWRRWLAALERGGADPVRPATG